MNPYPIIGLLVAWIASLGAVGYWQNQAGHTAERAVTLERDNEALARANSEIRRLEEAARAAERRHAEEQDVIATGFQKELVNAKAQKDRDVAAARAGALRLRFRSEGDGACPGRTGQAATGAGQRDAAAGSELPRAVTEFLLGFANDADEVTLQLTACQKILVEDRSEKRATGP